MKKVYEFERLNLERIEGKYATYKICNSFAMNTKSYEKGKKPKLSIQQQQKNTPLLIEFSIWVEHNSTIVMIFTTTLRVFWLNCVDSLSHSFFAILWNLYRIKMATPFQMYTHICIRTYVFSQLILLSLCEIYNFFPLFLTRTANKNKAKVIVKKVLNANRLCRTQRVQQFFPQNNKYLSAWIETFNEITKMKNDLM